MRVASGVTPYTSIGLKKSTWTFGLVVFSGWENLLLGLIWIFAHFCFFFASMGPSNNCSLLPEKLLAFSAIGIINLLSRESQTVQFRPGENIKGAEMVQKCYLGLVPNSTLPQSWRTRPGALIFVEGLPGCPVLVRLRNIFPYGN